MLRPFAYETVLFLLPFLAYGFYLLSRGRNALTLAAWADMPLLRLLIVSFISIGIGLAIFAHYRGEPADAPYHPAHIENGRIVGPDFR